MLETDITRCGAGCALPRRCALAFGQIDRVVGDLAGRVGGRAAVTAARTTFQGGPVIGLYLF
jgi:hypothetical protein